jgi:hypothetical protein
LASAPKVHDPRQQHLVLLGKIVDARQQEQQWGLSESIPSGGIPRLNQTAPICSMPHC